MSVRCSRRTGTAPDRRLGVIAHSNDGFLYSNGTLIDLGSFLATAINNNGVIVGEPTTGWATTWP
jgi:hypothetical protein